MPRLGETRTAENRLSNDSVTAVTVSPPVSTATGVTPEPTVSGTGTATVSAPTAQATAVTPEPSVTGTGTATVNTPTAQATGVTPEPSISAGVTLVSVPTAQATGVTPEPSVTVEGPTVSPPTATATGVTPEPSVTGTGTATVSAPTAVATAVTPEPDVIVGTGRVEGGLALANRPEQLIRDFIVDNWSPDTALGYDPTVADPDADNFLPISTSVSNVGQHYPNIVVSFGNETSAGETTYNYLTSSGPGQVRNGSVVVTVRTEETDSPSYRGDTQYSEVDAEELNQILLDEVERIVIQNSNNPSGTKLSYLGSLATADAPDDLETTPIVRIADRNIEYGWYRDEN